MCFLLTNFNMHGIYLMCISSIFLCVVVFLQVTDIWAMVTCYLSWEWSVVPSYSTKYCKRGQQRSWHKDFQPIALKVLCTSVSLHNCVSVNIVLIPKPCLSPWLEHLNLFLSIPPCCCIHGAQQGCLLIDTLSEVCDEGARNVETPPNNKSHPFTFMILRSKSTAGTFLGEDVSIGFSSYFETIIMVYMPCFWVIVMAQHMP